MMKPIFAEVEKYIGKKSKSMFCGTNMNTNPIFYKYQWRIFWRGSPCEGDAFMKTEPLSTKAAMDLIAELKDRNESCIIYNYKLPRLGVAIWDLTSDRFANAKFAPAYDDDSDPIFDGHR